MVLDERQRQDYGPDGPKDRPATCDRTTSTTRINSVGPALVAVGYDSEAARPFKYCPHCSGAIWSLFPHSLVRSHRRLSRFTRLSLFYFPASQPLLAETLFHYVSD